MSAENFNIMFGDNVSRKRNPTVYERLSKKHLQPVNAYQSLLKLCDNVGECVVHSRPFGAFQAEYFGEKNFEAIGTSEDDARAGVYEAVLKDFFINKIQTGEYNKPNAQFVMASFALHKLYTEWSRDGTQVLQDKIKISVDDWENYHPTSFLNEMLGSVNFGAIESLQTNYDSKYCTLKIYNKDYYGIGRSKKIARYNAAAEACNDLYGCQYVIIKSFCEKTEENTMD